MTPWLLIPLLAAAGLVGVSFAVAVLEEIHHHVAKRTSRGYTGSDGRQG